MHDAQPAEDPVLECGLLTVPEEVWQLAVRRAEVIGPLAAAPSVGAGAVEAAATELAVSRRQVPLLVNYCWAAGQFYQFGHGLQVPVIFRARNNWYLLAAPELLAPGGAERHRSAPPWVRS